MSEDSARILRHPRESPTFAPICDPTDARPGRQAALPAQAGRTTRVCSSEAALTTGGTCSGKSAAYFAS